jgi:hypothetical protein
LLLAVAPATCSSARNIKRAEQQHSKQFDQLDAVGIAASTAQCSQQRDDCEQELHALLK